MATTKKYQEMDKPAIPQMRHCWICFSNEHSITLTMLDLEKVLKNCETYLDISITKESFENKAAVSCCRYCYESTSQLTLLGEQVQKLQKEISDLSFLFSKNVLERRSGLNTAKHESANQTDEHLLNHRYSNGYPIVDFENVTVKKEFIQDRSNELQVDTGLFNIIDSDEYENAAAYKRENVFYSEDDCDVKYSYDETVSKEKVDTVIANITSNQGISATNITEPQATITSIVELLKCSKKLIIPLESVVPRNSKNSANMDFGDVEENINCEQWLDDSSDPKNCSETRSKDLPFKCDEISCSKSFKYKSELIRHQQSHSGERPFKCSQCSNSFKSSRYLKQHEKIHSEPGEKPYKCSLCSKSYKRLDNLKEHQRLHSGETPYKCREISCSKSFKSRNVLVKHERIHSGEKPYKCSFCSNQFRQSGQLKLHERTHTGETPYKCFFCKKSYARSDQKKRHERTHSGEAPYNCSFCKKSFRNSSRLKFHEKSHSKEKPYTCSNSKEAFTTQEILTRHNSRIHGECKDEFILS